MSRRILLSVSVFLLAFPTTEALSQGTLATGGKDIAIDPQGQTVFIAGNDYLIRSVDGGLTWVTTEELYPRPERVLVRFDDPQAVVVAKSGELAYSSTGGSGPWTVALQDSHLVPLRLTQSLVAPDIIFLLRARADTACPLWWSQDGGHAWFPQEQFTPRISLFDLAMYPDPSDTGWGGIAFLCGESGWSHTGPYDGFWQTWRGYVDWYTAEVVWPALQLNITSVAIIPRPYPVQYPIRFISADVPSGRDTIFSNGDFSSAERIPIFWAADSIRMIRIRRSSHHVFVASDRGIFRSTDEGVTWEQKNLGLADTNIQAIALPDLGGKVFAVTPSSTFISTDNGESWHAVVIGNAVSVSVAAGWNMISNPVNRPASGDSVRQLYPRSAFPFAYRFDNGTGFQQDSTLKNGVGYWARFPAAQTSLLGGDLRTSDTMNVVMGWNMIGSVSDVVDTSTIISIPDGIRMSSWIGYPEGGYVVAPQIIPGKGYWVKASSAGKFVMSGGGGVPKRDPPVAGELRGFNTLVISDSRRSAQTLYFGTDDQGKAKAALYEMPPLPPVGAFDARFETADGSSMVQMHAANVSSGAEFPVAVRSDAYPLTISWNVKSASYELTDGVGGRVFGSKEMKGEGSIEITNSNVTRFSVKLTGDAQIPKQFALLQNYPNPFNPSTTIKYNLPKDSRVSLKVYNILGQEVATLVNEEQKAGYKTVDWNASHVASGVYFYRLSTSNFVQTRKLSLLR